MGASHVPTELRQKYRDVQLYLCYNLPPLSCPFSELAFFRVSVHSFRYGVLRFLSKFKIIPDHLMSHQCPVSHCNSLYDG